MQVCLFIETQRGTSYESLARLAQHAEQHGFHGLFLSDHYQPAVDRRGLAGPTDAWTSLAGLARDTARIRLGTLVTCATFRLPAPLAIIAAQVDQMSNGRVELGIGAGWHQPEHTCYGIPFPPVRERFDRLAEQLEIITGLWTTPAAGLYSHHGRYYQLLDAPPLPLSPQQPHPPIIIGGQGRRRTPQLAVQYADEYNAAFLTVAQAAAQFRRVTDAAQRVGRTGRPLRLSAGLAVACGQTISEALHRAASLNGSYPSPPTAALIGSPNRVVERIGQYADAGATRIYLRLPNHTDLDHLDLLAQQVLPQLPPDPDHVPQPPDPDQQTQDSR